MHFLLTTTTKLKVMCVLLSSKSNQLDGSGQVRRPDIDVSRSPDEKRIGWAVGDLTRTDRRSAAGTWTMQNGSLRKWIAASYKVVILYINSPVFATLLSV